jgi:hypothetical protein
MNFTNVFRAAKQWFSETPERALDQAYKAALLIKAIEDEHFDGQKISTNAGKHTNSVVSYFESDLNKYLQTIRVRLAEFKSSRSVFSGSEPKKINTNSVEAMSNPAQYYPLGLNDKQEIIIEKLNFIDQILTKYSEKSKVQPSTALISVSQQSEKQVVKSEYNQNFTNNVNGQTLSLPKDTLMPKGTGNQRDAVPNKPGVLPRSILRTFTRIQEELDPQAEEKVVSNFRSSKLKTIISLKFILTLIIVPILTQQLTKNFLVGPAVEHFRHESTSVSSVFLNLDMEEEAFADLKKFEEELNFKTLLGFAPKLSEEEKEEKVKEKAEEIAEEYRDKSRNAIKNVFADLLSVAAFLLVIFNSKKEVIILKSFMDDVVYGLSDSAKAFIIILFTDIFVGFHSPHGWEVILEGISRHLGIPENRSFIFLFIATFPVILDSVIKYWIFRYLNRVSPSAVATLRGMNE